MESDIYSDIPSQYGLLPEVDNDIPNFFATLEETSLTSLFLETNFDESSVFDLSQCMDVAEDDQSQLLGDNFSYANLPILPPTFNVSVENQPL